VYRTVSPDEAGVACCTGATACGVWVTCHVAAVSAGAVVAGEGDPAAAASGAVVRSLWQYRHLMASSWIISAQKGHFFTGLPPVVRGWLALLG
jgi:hypothetical protein